MASEIILDINGYSCNVLKFNYEFYRKIDSKGRPVMGLQGGDIYVELESKEESTILEFMLSERNPLVRGRIKLSDESSGSMIRELIFDEAYIFSYGERMNAEGNAPMAIWFAISATRLDVNRILQLDRRIATTHGLWWQEYKEEEQIVKPVSGNAPPSPLVTSVQGSATTLPRKKVKYSVTGYSLNQVNENDRKRVKWMVQVDGKKEVQKIQGEVLELLIEDKWAGKEIIVMPFLKEATEEVCIKTAVQKKIVALFIGGAADKNEFYGIEATTLIEDQAKRRFDKDIKVIKTIACTTMYLGYDEIYRDAHVEGLSKTITDKRTPVYIVGHSLGGWNGAHLSQILTDKGIILKC